MSKIGQIALYLTITRDKIKFYHWATKSYSRHIASDTLVSNLTENMDRFVEVMSGSEGKRLTIPSNFKYTMTIETDVSIVKELKTFRDWLIEKLPTYLENFNTELLNIRDEILADVNNTLYLFTLN
jgi:hypothetical protein